MLVCAYVPDACAPVYYASAYSVVLPMPNGFVLPDDTDDGRLRSAVTKMCICPFVIFIMCPRVIYVVQHHLMHQVKVILSVFFRQVVICYPSSPIQVDKQAIIYVVINV